MQRPGRDEYDSFYASYIERVPDTDVISEMKDQFEETIAPISRMSDQDALSRYSPEKWSIKEVVGHLSDGERVMAYRALRIARGDQTPLASFDEDAFVRHAQFDDRSTASLLEEWRAVREASVRLFEGFSTEVSIRRGIASGAEVSVRALAYVIAGHELHHRAILQERYGVDYSTVPADRRG